MEFRLNKIDTDIRRKLSEETKDEKVHRKQGISIDNKMKKPFVEHREYKKQKKKDGQYITVDGIKEVEKGIVIEAEMIEENSTNVFSGRFIDEMK